MREADDFQSWWQTICATAEKLEFLWLALSVTNPNGISSMRVWRCAHSEPAKQDSIRIILPVCDRKLGSSMRMEFAVSTHDSLEAAGRRITYFSRLLEECCPKEIPRNLANEEQNYTFISRRSIKKQALIRKDEQILAPREITAVGK
jgi:hypothetical protein